LPIEVVDQIAERADGVPLFVEELSKAILEAESRLAGTLSKPAFASVPAIPASLQASLMARLDRLDPPAKHIAQIGAAIGRTFSYELTTAVAESIGVTIEPGLESLVNTGLVFRQGSAANAQFVFKHGLVQDAAYLTLIRSKRRQIHAGIAQALETLFPETCEQHPEILGHHFTEAAEPEKALKYWRLAVEHALRTSAYREAIRHCTSGLSIINSIERREKRLREELSFQLQLGVASTASLGPSSPAMRDSFGRAAKIAEELQDDRSLAGAVLGLWAHHNALARLQPALALADRLIAIAETRDDDALRVRGHAASLTVSYKMGALESAWQHFESGTSLYRPDMRVIDVIPNYVAPGPDMLLHGSFVAWVMGYPERARKLAAETMAAAQRLAQPYTITHCVYMLGHLAELQGDWPEVRRANEQTVELATRWGFTGTLELVSRRIALVAVVTERDKEQFRHKCEHRQPGFARSLHDVELARMCLTLGMIDRGLALLGETLAYSCETGSSFYDAEVYRTQGQLFAATQRWHDAESSYYSAMRTAQRQKARLWELRAATDLALLRRERGDHQQAADLLYPLYASFTEGSDVRELRAAKALLNELQYKIPQQPPRR
jgi:tetratricopeptide (TPR) repeat protein